MDDRALYATILGLDAPWEVERVELKATEQVVHVWVTAPDGTSFVCPECGTASPIYDHGERSWRHLDTCQFQTLLHAAVPRVTCTTHGVRTIRVPWAEKRSHFTLLFERLAIAWLKEATPLAVARRLGLTWEEANGIVERAVRRGLARRTSVAGRRLGIDEHSYLRHFQFVTMVVDLDEQTVLHVADDRTAESLDAYFAGLSLEERTAIEAIAMDMWEPYRKTVRAHVPCDGSDGSGATKGTTGPHAARRSPTDRHQVSLAEDAGTVLYRRSTTGLRTVAPEHPQVGARVGDEGGVASPLGISVDPPRPRLFRPLVRLGDAVAARAHALSREDPASAHREHPDLPHASHHQRRDRRIEREDPVGQILVTRVPRSRAVQTRDLLPLRRTRSRTANLRKR